MNSLWNRYGEAWLFSLLPCLSLLFSLEAVIGIKSQVALLAACLLLWSLVLMLADSFSPVAGPLVLIVFYFLLLIRIYDGIGIFSEVVLYLQTEQEELWIASDLVLLLGGMVLSAVLMYLGRFFWTRILLSAAFLGLWITCAILELSLAKISVVLLVPLILLPLIELLHIRAAEDKKARNSGIRALLSVSLLSLVLLMMPFSAEPWPYTWLHRAWDGAQELWKKIDTQLHYRSKDGTEFVMDFNGPAEKTTLGANNEDQPVKELRVWSDFGDESVIYLPGTSMDFFDGKSWYRSLDDERVGELFHWNLDTAEQVYALYRMDRDDEAFSGAADYFRKRRLEISYREMNTKTLFTTAGLTQIRNDEERFPYKTLAGRVVFDYTQEKDSRYTLFYLEKNTENLPKLIQASEGYTYDASRMQSWGQISSEYEAEFLVDILRTTQMEEVLAQREALIREYYLQLPEDFSEDVRQLALDITAGCETDYEKILAVEAYLHDNFSYTLTPQLSAPGEDFLEHMMETREGYCTWFATASSMMLRALGIPSRYVEGFRTVIPRQTAFILREKDAHAWCEAYIQGYGWFVVESTPGLASAIFSWEVQEEAREEAEDPMNGAEEPQDQQDGEKTPEERPRNTGRILLICLAALILISLAALWLIFTQRKKKYLALSYRDRCLADLKKLLKKLAALGYVRYPYESIRTFFERVYWQGLAVDPKEAMEVCEALEDGIFGEKEIPEQSWQKMTLLYETVRKNRRKK